MAVIDRPRAAACVPVLATLVLLPLPVLADVLERRGEAFTIGNVALSTPAAQRELVAVEGAARAFRFDGNSNWLTASDPMRLEPSDGLAVGAWVALASPPGDTAAVVYLAEDGLLLGVNRWRQPEIRLGDLRAAGSMQLPVATWSHLAGDYDGQTLRLRVNGEIIAERRGVMTRPIEGTFAIGRALDAGLQEDTHPLGVVNGILADVTLRRSPQPIDPDQEPGSPPNLAVPEAWYAGDLDRPGLTPLGEAGWTNEPHALTWREGRWHLYHQVNPNGAFWRNIVWGHLVSGRPRHVASATSGAHAEHRLRPSRGLGGQLDTRP
jgi:hypothetical protein